MSVASAPSAPERAQPVAHGRRRGAGCSATGRSIPLLGLLVVLVVILSELVRPGIVNPNWGGVMLRTAVPLAILAGCQTLTMLTGGIDLSVGAVASMSGFVVATLVGDSGPRGRPPGGAGGSPRSPGSSPASASACSGSTR